MVGVDLDRVAGQLAHGVVLKRLDVLAEPAGAEEEVGQELLLELEVVVRGLQPGEVGLDVVVLGPVVDRAVGDAGILVVAVGDAVDGGIGQLVDDRHRVVQRRGAPHAVVLEIPRIVRHPAEGCEGLQDLGRIGLHRRIILAGDQGGALEERDGGAVVDLAQGAVGVFKLDARQPLGVAGRVRRVGRQEVAREGAGPHNIARDITGRGRGRDIGAGGYAGVQVRDQARGRVIGRAARRQPGRHEVARGERVRPVGVVLVVFRERPDGRVLERLEGDRAVFAAGEVARRLALELLVVVEQRAIDRQFVLDQRNVEVDGGTERAVVVGPELELVAVLVERRLGRRLVDDAGGGAEAEEEGVRAARDFDRLGVVGVERYPVVDGIVVDRGIRHADAADAVGLGIGLGGAVVAQGVAADGVLGGAAVRDHGRVGTRAFGAGLVFEHVVDIQRAGVIQLLLRHDGDRRGEVGEVGVQPAAGERVFRVVTGVLGRGDLEGGQHQPVVGLGGGRGGLDRDILLGVGIRLGLGGVIGGGGGL